MVAKLSSASTMSAASLATSVPVTPMATPMSACCRAGASLTPSPVMATTAPQSPQAPTSRSFRSGLMRANTRVPAPRRPAPPGPGGRARRRSGRRRRPRMPTRSAIAAAVRASSPVIITGVTPVAAGGDSPPRWPDASAGHQRHDHGDHRGSPRVPVLFCPFRDSDRRLSRGRRGRCLPGGRRHSYISGYRVVGGGPRGRRPTNLGRQPVADRSRQRLGVGWEARVLM